MSRPSRLLAAAFRAPDVVYRVRLGWMLGRRFLELTHRGRRSGRDYRTVLEVIAFAPDREESVVASAYGVGADWYRNLMAGGGVRVRTGRLDYTPEHRVLGAEEAQEVAAGFVDRHPWEARLVSRVLPAIGAALPEGAGGDPAGMLASLPLVAFRPEG